MIPLDLSARDRLRSEGYRVSDSAEFTKQNFKGDITGLRNGDYLEPLPKRTSRSAY